MKKNKTNSLISCFENNRETRPDAMYQLSTLDHIARMLLQILTIQNPFAYHMHIVAFAKSVCVRVFFVSKFKISARSKLHSQIK